MPTRQVQANAIRALSMDAVQQAQSGHPGMPMGMADIMEVLWNDFLNHNPRDPNWCNRDRFVLSNGHGCMLLYSALHLSGYDLSLEDLKQFRQLHSKTPGHPEYGMTPGVETTTGPLGQGLANGVGMALAERSLAAQFNRDSHSIVDHHTYVFVGDGCLMEGISHEAASLAGTQGLGKLIVLYDDNGISIDGEVKDWFADNTPERFRAYHWQVIDNVDGHNANAIKSALQQAKANSQQPTLICCKTTIGFGSPNVSGKAKSHGAPLGDAEIALTKQSLHWPHGAFEIPDAIYAYWNAQEKGLAAQQSWQHTFDAYAQAYPELSKEFIRRTEGRLPADYKNTVAQTLHDMNNAGESMATRKASLKVLNQLQAVLPELIGGSADLTGSNLTLSEHSKAISTTDASGNYIYFGVREFAMSAILNGLAVHGGFIPYGGTFLVFSDYARNAVRLSALMKQRVIYVYTHDSIGLGEDGPTHQPVEHLAMLRITPNLNVWRPCDTVETLVAWHNALEDTDGPSALCLTRQTTAHQVRDEQTITNIAKGGYILIEPESQPDAIIIATGSEVELAVSAAKRLASQNIAIRVVSMPCAKRFDAQSADYKNSVLPNTITQRVAVEAAAKDYWYKYVGLNGTIIGLERFGESAPYQQAYAELGITEQHVCNAVIELLKTE